MEITLIARMQIASYIDHTLLRVDATAEQIQSLCQEALEYGFASVCVPPFFVKKASQFLQAAESSVKVATVVGFPMGYSSTAAKIEEIKRAIDDGADEIDAVINVCALKSQNWSFLTNDMDSMATATHLKGKKIKLILETGLLDMAELERVAEIALQVKPDFVKTSTGFNGVGAELEKVLFLQKLVGNTLRIKASGGIRDFETANTFIQAGASRIGTSSGIAIMEQAVR
jgi:deoxyribose-phosphate aldolase